MTTVVVYIKKIDGPDSFALHNGMLGPATTALHALIDAFTTGAISGQWHSSYIDTTVPGRSSGPCSPTSMNSTRPSIGKATGPGSSHSGTR